MTTRISQAQARQLYTSNFDAEPTVIASAPGRVNLIGEHTDYNLGYVLPIAIERRTFVALGPSGDGRLHLVAADLDRRCTLDADTAVRQPDEPWADYLLGVLNEWRLLGRSVGGLNILVTGDVPVACGLSSSASVEMALFRDPPSPRGDGRHRVRRREHAIPAQARQLEIQRTRRGMP